MTQVIGIVKAIASDPSALNMLVVELPALFLIYLLYRIMNRSDQNFAQLMRVIKDLKPVIERNSDELAASRANRERDDHHHRRG